MFLPDSPLQLFNKHIFFSLFQLFKKHYFFSFQGGFAKCYELTDADTKEIFAGKIVPKSLLVKQHQKDKV